MKLNFLKSSLMMLLLLTAAGCNTTGPGGSAPTATGPVVAQGNMPEYCQTAASKQYGATLGNITTVSPVRRSFGFLVTGTADTGQQTYIFNCRFDSRGSFLGISET
jgi:hypothetical protein